MKYMLINENDIISEFIELEDKELSLYPNAKELYTGAKIGDKYIPKKEIEEKVEESKITLSNFLDTHPLLYTDGKYYSVSLEKQNLLSNNILSYQVEVNFNPDAKISWNAMGEVCQDWEIADITQLALAIKNYVKPFVTKQQELEIQIKNCETLDELNAIEINYLV